MSCDFSESIEGTLTAFSKVLPESSLVSGPTSLLSVSNTRLTLRDADSLQVLHIYICIDKIEYIAVSPDQSYVLCAMSARNTIQVFSLTDYDWSCRINESIAGLIRASWTPDSRHILTESQFGIQISVWSLTTSSSIVISNPKSLTTGSGGVMKSFAFSDCGSYLAVIHRLELQDHVGIYSTNPWEELSKFRCQSNDALSIQWLTGGLHLIVVDSPLSYRVGVYTPSGQVRDCY